MNEFRRSIRRWLGGADAPSVGQPRDGGGSRGGGGGGPGGGGGGMQPSQGSSTAQPSSPGGGGPGGGQPVSSSAAGASTTIAGSGASWSGGTVGLADDQTLLMGDGSVAQHRYERFAPAFGGDGVHNRWDLFGATLADTGSALLLASTGADLCSVVADHTGDWDHQSAEAFVTASAMGPSVRMQGLAGYSLHYQAGGPNVQLVSSNSAGGIGIRATYGVAGTGLFKLEAETIGGNVTLRSYRNGVLVGTYVDNSAFKKLAGGVGLSVRSSSGPVALFESLRLD